MFKSFTSSVMQRQKATFSRALSALIVSTKGMLLASVTAPPEALHARCDLLLGPAVSLLTTHIGLREVVPDYLSQHFRQLVARSSNVRQLLLVLLKCAESCPQKVDGGETYSQMCDMMALDLLERCIVYEVGQQCQDSLRGLLLYGMFRVQRHLQRTKKRVPQHDIAWKALRTCIFQGIRLGMRLSQFSPNSCLGKLFVDPGFLTIVEVISRVQMTRTMDHLSGVFFSTSVLIRWVLAHPVVGSNRACRDLLRTLFKLQQMVHLIVETDTHPLDHCTEHYTLSEGLKCLRETLTAPDIPVDNALLLYRILITGFDIIKLAKPASNNALTRHVRGWEERVRVLTPLASRFVPNVGCRNPVCTELQGFTEPTMTTKWCSGCEKVQYCSVECHRKDWAEHRAECSRLG